MTYINNIVEPTKLWLMWQDNTDEKKRHKVGFLTEKKFEYLNDDELAEAKDAGFIGYPAFDIENKKYNNALSSFINRCPPKERRDYDVYLSSFGLDPESDDVKNISDFALLGYTGAFLHGNPFTLVNDYDDLNEDFDFIVNVSRSKDNYFAEHKYDENNKKELIGEKLTVEPENHPKDPNAVKVMVNDEHLGYIQTGLNQSFKKWNDSNQISEMKITKVNGSEVNPNVYAYVKIGKNK